MRRRFPQPDERSFPKHVRLDPGTCLGKRLRHLPRLQFSAVDQSANLGLQLALAHDLRLTEKERQFGQKLLAPFQ